MELFSYDNPTGRCQDCPLHDGEHSCCDRSDRNDDCRGGNNQDPRRCDTQFMFCLRPLNSTGRNCSYLDQVTSNTIVDERGAINFTRFHRLLGLDNPLSLPGLADTYTVSMLVIITITHCTCKTTVIVY